MSKDNIFAAIDIGSHELLMKIVEINKDGNYEEIENVSKINPLGRDTFNTGKLGSKLIRKTIKILIDFKKLMSDYNVKHMRVIATSAVREAKNMDFVLYKIEQQTEMDIEVINNSQEKYLTFRAIKDSIIDEIGAIEKRTLILDVGAGGIQISVCDGEKLVSSQSIKLGVLRIREILSSLEQKTLNYSKVIDEYIGAHIESLDFFKKSKKITNFTVAGSIAKKIYDLINGDTDKRTINKIDKKSFNQLYDSVITLNSETLVSQYNLSFSEAEILVPALILIKKFLDKTNMNDMFIPQISLIDGIVHEYIDSNIIVEKKEKYSDIISHARVLSSKFKYNKDHAEYVEKKSLKIFDALSEFHDLHDERILLQIAAIMHDIGKFICPDSHYRYSKDIIKASEMIGFSDEELNIISYIAFFHSAKKPDDQLSILFTNKYIKITVAKLIAIIRLADALDTSHKQKIENIQISTKLKKIIITGEAEDETLLELWTFEQKAEYFEEVFGISVELKVKNKLISL